jgi:hypothetical protein
MSGEGYSGWGNQRFGRFMCNKIHLDGWPRNAASRTTYLSANQHSQRTTTNDRNLDIDKKTKKRPSCAAKFVRPYYIFQQQCGSVRGWIPKAATRMPTIQDCISDGARSRDGHCEGSHKRATCNKGTIGAWFMHGW